MTMLNNKVSNQFDVGDLKLNYKSTSKNNQSNIDRGHDNDINNNNFEKLNEKLITFIRSSNESKHHLDYKLQDIERQLHDQSNENEMLKTQIHDLHGKIEVLNRKVHDYALLEFKFQSLYCENEKLISEISNLKEIVIDRQKSQNLEGLQQIEKLQEFICTKINQMMESLEGSYNTRCRYLTELIRKMSTRESLQRPKNVSLNESYGNSSQGFHNVSGSNEDSEEETSKYSEKRNEEVTNPTVSIEKANFVVTANNSAGFKPKGDNIEIEQTKTPLFYFPNVANNICTPSLNSQSKSVFENNISKVNTPAFNSTSTLFGNSSAVVGNYKANNVADSKLTLFGSNSYESKPGPFTKPVETESQQTSNNFLQTKSSIFGTATLFKSNIASVEESVKDKQKTNLMDAEAESSLFSFGNKQKESERVSLFGSNANVPSFSSLAGSIEKGFGSVSETKWQGGSKLFSKVQPKDEGDSVKEDELNEHDPDFKPIIELPPLIEIVRDDDQKTVLFKNRCKLYRFVKGEWKERGVGDLKLLKSKTDGVVTLVMRREQIHKLCCNQRVTRDSHKLMSMGNEKTICWMSADFSDGESTLEKMAVKFADKSTVDEFSRILTEVQSSL